jgi:pilus assembly protein CpaB
MRIFLTIFAALLVAGGSGFYLLQGLRSDPQPVAVAEPVVERPAPTQVYVPATGLAAGTILVPDHLARLALEDETVSDEMIVANEAGRDLLVGSVARQALPRGVPIARSAVVKPGERGFLAAVLTAGKRAISIPVSETAGLSGLVTPGDRVDIILTYSVSGSHIDAGRDIRASETVLAGLRVLALDQRLQEADSTRTNDPGNRVAARTATLEVSPQEAEMLTLATRLGELSLVLNSLDDGEPVDPEAVVARAESGIRAMTLDSQVTTLLHRDTRSAESEGESVPLAERLSRVQIVRGIDSRAQSLAGGRNGAAGESIDPAFEADAGTLASVPGSLPPD